MSTNAGAGVRTPPRFVPTLTEVVHLPEGLPPLESVVSTVPEQPWLEMTEPAAQASARHRVDALLWTDAPAVQPPQVQQEYLPAHETPVSAQASQPWPTPDLLEALGVLITEQVMQRLEQRLAVLVDEHAAQMAGQLARHLTEALSLQLRAEVPELVQQAVTLAVQPTGQSGVEADHQRGFSAMYEVDVDSG